MKNATKLFAVMCLLWVSTSPVECTEERPEDLTLKCLPAETLSLTELKPPYRLESAEPDIDPESIFQHYILGPLSDQLVTETDLQKPMTAHLRSCIQCLLKDSPAQYLTRDTAIRDFLLSD